MRSIIETGRRSLRHSEVAACGFSSGQSGLVLRHWERASQGRSVAHEASHQADEITQRLRRTPLSELLSALTESHGLRLGDIALIAGVSRAALRKWRDSTARPERERHRQLCRLGAFCEQLVAAGGAPAEWLEVQFDESDGRSSDQRVAHLLALGHFDLAWKHFRREVSDSDVLVRVFPNRAQGIPDIEWTVSVSASDEASYVASFERLGLVAVGSTRSEAQESLVDLVDEYVDDWYEDLRKFPNHQPNAAFVLAADAARQEGDLSALLFGR